MSGDGKKETSGERFKRLQEAAAAKKAAEQKQQTAAKKAEFLGEGRADVSQTFEQRRTSVATGFTGSVKQTSAPKTSKDLGIKVDQNQMAATRKRLEATLGKKIESSSPSSPKSADGKRVEAVAAKMGKDVFKGITNADPAWFAWQNRLNDERQKGMVEQFFIKFKAGTFTMEQVEKSARMQGIPPMNEANVPLTTMQRQQQPPDLPPTKPAIPPRPPKVPPRPKDWKPKT